MALVRWSPLTRALSQWPEAWDDDFFSLPLLGRAGGLDLYETEKQVVVKANVAGVPEDKIDLTFEKGLLTISASMENEEQQEKDEGRTYYARSSRNYSYSVRVPGEVDMAADPAVDLEDGMLTVTFEKSQAAQPRKLAVKRKQK